VFAPTSRLPGGVPAPPHLRHRDGERALGGGGRGSRLPRRIGGEARRVSSPRSAARARPRGRPWSAGAPTARPTSRSRPSCCSASSRSTRDRSS